jgi:hypothetical protein
MKRVELHRSVKEGPAGAIVDVRDDVAKRLCECPSVGAPPSATVITDLGADPPLYGAFVRITKPVSAGGQPRQVGDVVGLSARDAKLLLLFGKAELVDGPGGGE